MFSKGIVGIFSTAVLLYKALFLCEGPVFVLVHMQICLFGAMDVPVNGFTQSYCFTFGGKTCSNKGKGEEDC